MTWGACDARACACNACVRVHVRVCVHTVRMHVHGAPCVCAHGSRVFVHACGALVRAFGACARAHRACAHGARASGVRARAHACGVHACGARACTRTASAYQPPTQSVICMVPIHVHVRVVLV